LESTDLETLSATFSSYHFCGILQSAHLCQFNQCVKNGVSARVKGSCSYPSRSSLELSANPAYWFIYSRVTPTFVNYKSEIANYYSPEIGTVRNTPLKMIRPVRFYIAYDM